MEKKLKLISDIVLLIDKEKENILSDCEVFKKSAPYNTVAKEMLINSMGILVGLEKVRKIIES